MGLHKRIIAAFILLQFFIAGNTQCRDDCKDNTSTSSKRSAPTQLAMNNTKSNGFSCKLTSTELRKRKQEVLAVIKKHVLATQNLPNSYRYKFSGTDEMIDTLTAFIKTERRCCDFFSFKIAVSSGPFIWLEISGPAGVKEFIKTELGL